MTLAVLDRLDSLRLAKTGVYEPAETAFVKKVLRPGQVFVDVGAHIGYYSTLAAMLVGPEGKVFAFEPCPVNYALLERNIEPYSGTVRTYPLAVSDAAGYATLYLSDENSGDHRLAYMPERDSLFIRTIALDDFDPLRGEEVGFLKIDVQGHEYEVLKGALRILTDSEDIMGLVEFSPELLRLAGVEPRDVLSLLEDLRFKIYMRRGESIVPAPVADLPKRKHHANLLISRSDIA